MTTPHSHDRRGNTARRGTFSPPTTDIFDKYRHIKRRSSRAIAFIEGECRVPSGRNVGKPYRLRPYQKRTLRQVLDGKDILTAIISAPRGWGKTGLLAPLLVFFLFDTEGSQVIAASTAMRTARLSYDRAVRIITTNPRLNEQVLVFYNATQPYVDMPHRGSQLFPLPADEKNIVGMSPMFILIDEVGYVPHSTFEAMQTSLGKGDGTLLVGIGTPGLGTTDGSEPNLMWALREASRSEVPPPGLVYVEFSADAADDPARPTTWKKANPAVGDLIDPKAIANDYATMPLARFGQMRLGMWTQHESAWMPVDEWDGLTIEPGPPHDGASITIGFDGSVGGDATALTFYEPASGRVGVLGFWERPQGERGWKVPRREVRLAIEDAFSRYNVIALYYDPYFWRETFQDLASIYGEDRVIEFATNHAGRMAPATDAFRTAVVTGELSHDGHPALRSHILSAVAKQTPAGDVIVKDARRPQHIDLAVAAILSKEAARTVEVITPAVW